MFTGIVEEVGTIKSTKQQGDLRLRIAAKKVLTDLGIGDSIAVNGCCLTVISKDQTGFEAELSKETQAKTAPYWQQGHRVNLERAMQADSRFGGHIVSGHVETTGEILALREEPGAFVMTVKAAETLAKYLIPKGSITVDGISLTLVDVGGPGGSSSELAADEFTLWLIPHTLNVTSLRDRKPGDLVNLEPDLIAKYLERLSLMASYAKKEAHV